MKISKYFTLEECINTSYKEFKEAQEEEVKQFVNNLYIITNYIMDPIREYYNAPITVNSGFRGVSLNKKIGGVLTSDHTCLNGGAAIDFTVKGKTVDEVFKDIISGKIGIIYRQVINEKHKWIHIASLRFPFNEDDKYLEKLITEDAKTYKKTI